MVALIPSVLIALVFGVLVNRGVDQWFSANVSASVDNGASIGKAYIADVSNDMTRDLRTMASELGGARQVFDNRIQFTDALTQIAEFFGYPAVYVLNSQGEVLATGALPDAPPYISPPRSALKSQAKGRRPRSRSPKTPDTVRALYPLPGYGDAFLYVVRPLAPGLVAQMRSAVQSIDSYREAQESRARIQSAFILSYLETALLVLVGAVWLGMSAASSISALSGGWSRRRVRSRAAT